MTSSRDKPKFEFISYSGKYPNLCFGTLVFKFNGRLISGDVVLHSGGNAGFDSAGNEYVEKGPWKSVLSWDFKDYPELNEWGIELLQMINENVPFGCCGGCL